MCDSSLVVVLISWSEIVAKWCSFDSAHIRRSLMLQSLFLTAKGGCHLSGFSIVLAELLEGQLI